MSPEGSPKSRPENFDPNSGESFVNFAKRNLENYTRDKLADFKDAFKKVEPTVNPLDTTTGFWADRIYDTLIEPMTDALRRSRIHLDRINAMENRTSEQKVAMARIIQSNYEKEIMVAAKAAIGFLNANLGGDDRLTHRSIAEMEGLAQDYIKMMFTGNAQDLRELFGRIAGVTNLAQQDKDVLNTAFLHGGKKAEIAYVILKMISEGARDNYVKAYLEAHASQPQTVERFLKRGIHQGCFAPVDLNRYFNQCKTLGAKDGNEKLKKYGEEKLQSWDKDLVLYEVAYKVHSDFVKNAKKGLGMGDAKGGAAKYMNAKGLGIFLGYMCSGATMISNLVANSDLIFTDPIKFAKNPYILGALALFTGLRQYGKGKKITDIFQTAKETKRIERKEHLRTFKTNLRDYSGWGQFLDVGGDVFGKYTAGLVDKNLPLSYAVDIEEFFGLCKEKDKDSKNGSKQLETAFGRMSKGKTKKQFRKEFVAFMSTFKDMKISTQEEYNNEIKASKDLS